MKEFFLKAKDKGAASASIKTIGITTASITTPCPFCGRNIGDDWHNVSFIACLADGSPICRSCAEGDSPSSVSNLTHSVVLSLLNQRKTK